MGHVRISVDKSEETVHPLPPTWISSQEGSAELSPTDPKPFWFVGPGRPVYTGRVRTADFDFALPPELIAQAPASRRDGSRLLLLERGQRVVRHLGFADLLGLVSDDAVLVLNDSRVIPARLRAANLETGGSFELLLLQENGVNDWWAMVRPGKRAAVGRTITLKHPAHGPGGITATVTEVNEEGHRRLSFAGTENVFFDLEELGEIPLPPYIEREPQSRSPMDRERYQTVYANAPGSVAAPTAGLHFTPAMLADLEQKGVQIAKVTLHVGAGTFAPVKSERAEEHRMHSERYSMSAASAEIINLARRERRMIVAVGTTSLRVLESVPRTEEGSLIAGDGSTRLFLHPPANFAVVNALLTNFHLPQSTLLMLVCAFASPGQVDGREWVLAAYREAIEARYRFFSYGDAMFIR